MPDKAYRVTLVIYYFLIQNKHKDSRHITQKYKRYTSSSYTYISGMFLKITGKKV